MKVEDITEELVPLAEFYELNPDAKYLVRVDQAVPASAIEGYGKILAHFGLKHFLFVVGDTVKLFEIKAE